MTVSRGHNGRQKDPRQKSEVKKIRPVTFENNVKDSRELSALACMCACICKLQLPLCCQNF